MAFFRRLRYCALVLLLPLFAACGGMALTNPLPSDPRTQVVDLLKSFETGDPAPLRAINPNKYIQHNLGVEDGLDGLKARLAGRPPGATKVQTVRVFRDQDFVFAQTLYDFSGHRMVAFDIFRFEDGKIVEHWDNLEEQSAVANISGHGMLDGSLDISNRDRTSANKALMQAYMDDLLAGRRDRFSQYFVGNAYIQHNPLLGDGLTGLAAGLKSLAEHGDTVRYLRVDRILGEGNFVLVVSEGTFGDKPTAFYDLYRIDNYKIAEHWDTLQTIPPKSAWKNSNGKF